jgi:hypothetical protein
MVGKMLGSAAARWCVVVFVWAAALGGCADEQTYDCDAAPRVIGYRNGRVETGTVSCPSQCPKGTRAKRAECVWDCSNLFACVSESQGDAGAGCYSGGSGRNTFGLPGDSCAHD